MNFVTGIQIKYSNFSKTLEKAKDSASSISKSTETLKKVFIKRIDIKKKSFTREKLFKRRKLETSRRKEKEQKLETIPMTGKIGKSFSGVLQKASSPFSAIMNTLGLLALGWLINNLPSIIKFVKDLYNRVVKIVDTIKSFITNLGNWFKNIGGVITAVKDNITNLDFTDSKGKLKNALEQLDKSFESMKNDIEEGKRLLTTPLGEDGGSTSSGSSSYKPGTIPPEVKNDKEFTSGVSELAKKYNVPEDYLYAVMSFETGGTFDPAQKNMAGSGATGLIQFMPDTAKGLGTSTDELSQMTRSEQLKYVDKYFEGTLNKGASLSDVYMSVLLPAAVGKSEDFVLFGKGGAYGGSRAYSQNRGLDSNNDGSITKAEATAKVRQHLPGSGGSGGKYSYGSGSVVEYLTGDRSHPNFEYNGHGRESNYHEHIAFRTLQDKERAKAALRAAGIQIGSEYRPGDPGWHGANLAIDVPGAQWGGSGAIGQREYNGSAKVRSVLAEAGFSGSGIGQMTTRGSFSSPPMVSPDLGYPQGSQQAPIIIIDEEAPQPVQSAQMQQTPQMIVTNPLNRFMKNKMLLDLAYT